jgi:hypothetical protein
VISDGFHLWRNIITVASINFLKVLNSKNTHLSHYNPLKYTLTEWIREIEWQIQSYFNFSVESLHVMLDQPIKLFCQNPGKTSFSRYNRYHAALPDSRSCKSHWSNRNTSQCLTRSSARDILGVPIAHWRVRVWVERSLNHPDYSVYDCCLPRNVWTLSIQKIIHR